ncbi:TPA: hypothetical protein ACNNKN_004930, partial [Escherichia coli]
SKPDGAFPYCRVLPGGKYHRETRRCWHFSTSLHDKMRHRVKISFSRFGAFLFIVTTWDCELAKSGLYCWP